MAATRSNAYRLPCGVTVQQFRFLLAYTAVGNVPEATRIAGYKSENSGYQMLRNPTPQRVLEQIKRGEILEGEAGEERRRLIEELKAIAYSDITRAVKTPPDEWDATTAAAVARIKYHPAEKGGNVSEIAFWPKLDAIKQLALLFSQDEANTLPHMALPDVRTFRRETEITDIEPDTAADMQSAGDNQEASDTAADGDAHDIG